MKLKISRDEEDFMFPPTFFVVNGRRRYGREETLLLNLSQLEIFHFVGSCGHVRTDRVVDLSKRKYPANADNRFFFFYIWIFEKKGTDNKKNVNMTRFRPRCVIVETRVCKIIRDYTSKELHLFSLHIKISLTCAARALFIKLCHPRYIRSFLRKSVWQRELGPN